MYGEFQTPAPTTTSNGGGNSASGNRRSVRHSSSQNKDLNSPWHFRDAELFAEDLDAEASSIFSGGLHPDGQNRTRRQANNRSSNSNSKDNKYFYQLQSLLGQGFIINICILRRSDACESTVEVVTPYWAANSSGKIRAIVNTQHFEQAVHQEVCS